ncbi:MAG: pilus assembly protein PilM, partial [Candidatus Sumerlaeota bacterium]
DVDSFAFLNCFDLNYDTSPDDIVGLVNIGGDITTISVYKDGMPRFSRDISIGGSTITSAIQQRLGISVAEANTLKLNRGVPEEGGGDSQASGGGMADTIRSTVEAMTGEAGGAGDEQREAQADRAIRNTLSSLVGEIRRSIQFFENQSRGMRVKRLVMGGGASNIQRLDSYLQRELNLPVEIIDPLLRIPVSGKNISPDTLKEYRDTLSVSIGLALRKVLD